ncbi:AmmeMemoRadiSam system radical SAM enzyme [bacterium F16]|nr:AmmeMemoRadiSam system radical SAM enzyme [bacterium F16]
MKKCRTDFFKRLDDSRCQCRVCPNQCILKPSQRGRCGAFECQPDGIYSTIYGKVSSLCIDPIEKKPFHHFLPGSPTLSLGTVGCNLSCSFCQNWDISLNRRREADLRSASPEIIVEAARQHHCQSIACTYNEPTIFIDFCLDIADKAHTENLKMVAVTNGYIEGAPRAAFYSSFDAVNVDLKGFTDDFYRRHCGARLQPVLDTLHYIHKQTDAWLEITTLLIPGENDSEAELDEMFSWIHETLGRDVPLHLTAFYPQFKMLDKPATSATTVIAARDQAIAKGLNYVYTGNIHYPEGERTTCPSCNTVVIGRDRYEMDIWEISNGTCGHCGQPIAGVFPDQPGNWGSRRHPL